VAEALSADYVQDDRSPLVRVGRRYL
jgi:hypothetical protein